MKMSCRRSAEEGREGQREGQREGGREGHRKGGREGVKERVVGGIRLTQTTNCTSLHTLATHVEDVSVYPLRSVGHRGSPCASPFGYWHTSSRLLIFSGIHRN